MKTDEHLYLDVTQLAKRGWTKTLIEQFLGSPDRREAADHWANWTGKGTYFLERIQAAEVLPEFADAFSRSIRRRKASREQLACYMKQRAINKDAVRIWRQSLTEEDKKTMAALEKAANIFQEARQRGYRTPHKA